MLQLELLFFKKGLFLDGESFIGVVLAILFIALNGFFVLSEFSIVKVRKSKLEELIKEGKAGAKLALKITNSLDTYLSANQLGITLSSLALGWLGQPAIARLIGEPLKYFTNLSQEGIGTIALGVAFILITLLHVVLGELIPKSVAIAKTESVVLWVARPLHIFWIIFFPVIKTFDYVALCGMKLIGVKPAKESDLAHSEEEIKFIVSESLKGGVLDSMESEIIQNAIDFSDTVAKEVMTPRKDMVCLSKQKSLEANLQIIKETKYTRFPFIDGSKDTVLGLIHIRDILHAMLKNKEVDFNSIIREFIIVPENSSISNILNMMNKEKTYAALVLDEYGGTAGFVTLEDIVGEVFDEFEPDDDEEYKRIDDLNYEFSGRYELEELGEMLDMSFDDEQITIGGYVFNLFGRLPEVGESVSDDRCVYEVLAMDGAAIRRIKLTLKSSDS